MRVPAEMYLTLRTDLATGTLAQVRELTAPDQVADLAAQPLPLVLARLEEIHELVSEALAQCEVRCDGQRVGDEPDDRTGRPGREAGRDRGGHGPEAHLHGERPDVFLDRVPDLPHGQDRGPGPADRQPQSVHDQEQGEVIEMHAPARVTPDPADVNWID